MLRQLRQKLYPLKKTLVRIAYLRFYKQQLSQVDVCIVSYPKAGRTWVRVFLARYLENVYGVPFDARFSLERPRAHKIPKIWFTHTGTLLGKYFDRLYIKIFSWPALLQKGTDNLAGEKIVFLVRDPRDIAVSDYYQTQYRDQRKEAEGYNIHQFLRSARFGIWPVIAYTNHWIAHQSSFERFTLVRYEDLRRTPHAAFAELVDAVGLNFSKEALDEAIDFCQIEVLRERVSKNPGMFPGAILPKRGADSRGMKIRRGEIGGYQEMFTAADQEYCNRQLSHLDGIAGYTNSDA